MIGFVKLHREIFGTWIHADPKYFKAWCDILAAVNYEEKEVIIGTKVMICKEGEALFSLESWADLFNSNRKKKSSKDRSQDWTKQQVRAFFKKLTIHNFITTNSEGSTTRLSLIKRHETQHKKDTEKTQLKTCISTGYSKEKHKKDTKKTQNTTPTKEERNKEVNSLGKKDKKSSFLNSKESAKEKKVAAKKSIFEKFKDAPKPEFFTEKISLIFEEYAEMRRQKKAPIKTEISIKRLYKAIERNLNSKGEDSVINVIDSSITNEWTGLFFDRKNKHESKQRNSKRGKTRYNDMANRNGARKTGH